MSKVIYVLAAILIFGVLIAVHELGHFLAAKLCGVRVNEFSIGMGPVLWSRQRGETQYSLRALPIGGFCAMEGEEGDSDDPAALNRQGFWKQLLIFAAGAAMNFLTGMLIILALYSNAKGFYTATISGFAPEFTQQGDGLQEGDVLWQINGERVYLRSDLDLLFSLGDGEPFDLVVLRDGKRVTLDQVPLNYQTYTSIDGSSYQGYGIYIGDVVTATLAVKLQYTWYNTIDFVRLVRLSLQMLLSGKATLNDVSGPLGIVTTITQVGESSASAREAVENILYLAALIAVNLCVMNLLPIPALDGGRIFFLAIDTVCLALFRRRIPERYEAYVNLAGFVLLMGFMLIVTLYDVAKLF